MKFDKNILKSFRAHTAGSYKYLCYAPFNTLRFNENGLVTTCCVNIENVLGDYRTQSIAEILKSRERGLMQKSVLKNRLPEGCILCTRDLLNKNFDGLPVFWYGNYKNKKNIPGNIEFKLSLKCNLDCIMCSNNFRTECFKVDDNAVYGDAFVNELRNYIPELRSVTFNGGEPLVIDIYYEIWEAIIELNPECLITIHTNLNYVSERFLKIFERGNIKIVASLDSLKPEVYESIRLNADFKLFMHNLDLIRNSKYNINQVMLNFCPMQNNRFEIPDFVKFCNEKGLKFNFSVLHFPFMYSIFNMNKKDSEDFIVFLKDQYSNLPENNNSAEILSLVAKLESFYNNYILNDDYYLSREELIDNMVEIFQDNKVDYKSFYPLFSELENDSYFNLLNIYNINSSSSFKYFFLRDKTQILKDIKSLIRDE